MMSWFHTSCPIASLPSSLLTQARPSIPFPPALGRLLWWCCTTAQNPLCLSLSLLSLTLFVTSISPSPPVSLSLHTFPNWGRVMNEKERGKVSLESE